VVLLGVGGVGAGPAAAHESDESNRSRDLVLQAIALAVVFPPEAGPAPVAEIEVTT